jgi:hypothetical protein
MFNFIVTGCSGAWDNNQYELDLGRFGEYTDKEIIQRYKPLTSTAISELLSFPTLFAYEQGHNVDAHIGFLKLIRNRSKLQIEYEFYPNLPTIPATEINKLAWELDIAEWEMNRTHWALKDIDLLQVLVDAKLITVDQLLHIPGQPIKPEPQKVSNQLVITPIVFNIPNLPIESDLVSVMMPFDAAFNQVYSAIQSACSDAGLRCLRADSIWEESILIQEIFNLLIRSNIVIVDFSNKNPNVLYETGIAHTLGRQVVPISQSLDDLPFDLRHHHFLKYLPNEQGLKSMQSTLTERLKTLSRRKS